MARLLHMTLLFAYHFMNYAEGKRYKMREAAYLHDFKACPGVEYTATLNTSSVLMGTDDYRISLTADHERELEPLSAEFDVKICKTKSLEVCEDYINFPIDDLCTLFKEKKIQNSMILNHIEPPLKSCPVKGPIYMNDFPVNLVIPEVKKFLGFGYSQDEKVLFAQITVKSEEERIVCVRFVASFRLVRN